MRPLGPHALRAFLTAVVVALSGALTAPNGAAKSVSISDGTGKSIVLYRESYALIVGAGGYRAGWNPLNNVHNEVADVAEALEAHGFNVTTLLDPSSSELRDAVRDFIAKYGYRPENRLLFFFSGHGYSRGPRGFFVPVDAPDPIIDLEGFVRTAISMPQVMTWAREIEAKHAFFVFDSCFSGTLFKTKSLPPATEALIRSSTAKPVRQFLTAGDANQEVPAKSVFTPLFVRALNGAGDLNRDGYVTGAEIGLYIRQTQPTYAPELTPQYGKMRDPDFDEGDFVFEVALSQRLPAPPEPPVNEDNRRTDVELSFWQSIEDSRNVSDYRAYLAEFPDGSFARLARNRIAALMPPTPARPEGWQGQPQTAPDPAAAPVPAPRVGGPAGDLAAVRSKADAEAFLERHRDRVVDVFKARYEEEFHLWDEEYRPRVGRVAAHHIDKIRDIEILAVKDGAIELEMDYWWETRISTASNIAQLKIRVEPKGDTIVVPKAWR